MQKEIWKVYPYKSKKTFLLEISNLGNARRNNKLIDLSIRKTKCYYTICRNHLHRMVAELFVDNPNNYNEIDHINGDPHDNREVNLRWCTHKENINNIICINRMSANSSRKGKPAWNKGLPKELQPRYKKPDSEETRRKKSKSMKGKNNPCYGRTGSKHPLYGVHRHRVYDNEEHTKYHYEI